MKKILLVGIYDTNSVSLAPQVLRAYAEQFAVSKKYVIATKEFSIFSQSISEMVDAIKGEDADIVGFSAYIWNINEILEIVRDLKTKVIIGGPHVTGIEKELLQENPGIDLIVTGEGEVAFEKILEYYDGTAALSDIPGVTTRTIKTKPAGELLELDTIPSVYRRLFLENPSLSWISFETSRGCPMGCRYCAWSSSRKMRYYDLDRVLSDLDAILAQKSIRELYFCDSSLLLDKPRARKILNHICEAGSSKSVRFEFNAEQLDDESIDLLAKLVKGEVNLGIQTINPAALKQVRRTFNKEKFESRYAALVEKLKGCVITVDLIYGLPGDTLDGYKTSLDYALSLDSVGKILTNPLIVLPGSEFYRDRELYGFTLRDKKSWLVESNKTFSLGDMTLARKYSFYVAVLFLNSSLRDCLKKFAAEKGERIVDVLIDFMDTVDFGVTGDRFPDMIPSIKEGFRLRNSAFERVVTGYDLIVERFREFSEHSLDLALEGYAEHFADQFFKLRRFAGLEK